MEFGVNKSFSAPFQTLEGVVIFLAFLLSNLRALVFYSLFSRFAWVEIILWALTALIVIFILKRWGLIGDYWMIWHNNWLLGLFILLALASVCWSLDFYTTLFRALELLFATLVASYIGMRFRSGQLSVFLFWFGAILLILSLE